MKKFKPYLITAGIALVVVIAYPSLIRPFLQKLPVIGSYV